MTVARMGTRRKRRHAEHEQRCRNEEADVLHKDEVHEDQRDRYDELHRLEAGENGVNAALYAEAAGIQYHLDEIEARKEKQQSYGELRVCTARVGELRAVSIEEAAHRVHEYHDSYIGFLHFHKQESSREKFLRGCFTKIF